MRGKLFNTQIRWPGNLEDPDFAAQQHGGNQNTEEIA